MSDHQTNRGIRWAIRHETIYRYDTAVSFAPHVLRLSPRPDAARLLARQLNISPTPQAVSDFQDEFGNVCTRVTFDANRADTLSIESRVEVEPLTPLGSAALAGYALPSLPWPAPSFDTLAAFRIADGSAEVGELSSRLLAEVNGAPLAFFEHLSDTLYTMIDRQIRVEGSAQTPAQTLALGRGACRDLTVLYLAVCRSLGVAGRFVSGYQGQEASPDGKRHLHAWPEVYIPEHGWLGWDPTHGVPVDRGHIALSAAPTQGSTMPVDGGFYFNGPTVTSTLEYSITFDML